MGSEWTDTYLDKIKKNSKNQKKRLKGETETERERVGGYFPLMTPRLAWARGLSSLSNTRRTISISGSKRNRIASFIPYSPSPPPFLPSPSSPLHLFVIHSLGILGSCLAKVYMRVASMIKCSCLLRSIINMFKQ